MINFSYNPLMVLICMIFANSLSGQIWYKLDLLEDGETYQVSIVSEQNWVLPNNITSTGQVTIKAPTLELELKDFESVHPDLVWKYNSRLNAPEESSDFDYFSFGLESASRNFEYEEGVETPIIRFKNGNGCSDFLSLLDNVNDPFINSDNKAINIGNQLTIVGARGNAFKGIKGEKLVRCKRTVSVKEEYLVDLIIYPNLAFDKVNLSFDWQSKKQAANFYIQNSKGKTVKIAKQQLENGFNELSFDIVDLPGGIYQIALDGNDGIYIPMERFEKMYSASIDKKK